MVVNGNTLSFHINENQIGTAFVDSRFHTSQDLSACVLIVDSPDSVDLLQGSSECMTKNYEDYFIDSEVHELR
jgi:hypothetical protein